MQHDQNEGGSGDVGAGDVAGNEAICCELDKDDEAIDDCDSDSEEGTALCEDGRIGNEPAISNEPSREIFLPEEFELPLVLMSIPSFPALP